MASRAIFRRRKYILEHNNAPVLLPSSNSAFGRGTFGCEVEQSTVCHLLEQNPGDSNCEKARYTLRKRDILGLSNGFLRRSSLGVSLATYESGAQNFGFPLGVRYFLQSVRTASNTTGQPKVDIPSEQSEDKKQKQRTKETSPEECDQAVEGLSTAKAKAKAKQVQEVQKTDQSIIQKLWAVLLGIGPALRAVASMSRSWFPLS